MTRKTPVAVTIVAAAGALLAAGCSEHRVFGQRDYQGNVYGNTAAFPRNTVYGNANFRDTDRVSGPTEFARRPADAAQPASVRTDMASRSETSTSVPPQADVPTDEVSRSTAAAPTDNDRPVSSAHRPPVVEDRSVASADRPASDRPPVTTDRPPVSTDRPAATDRPTPPAEDRPLVRNEVKPEVAQDPGLKTSPEAPDGRDPQMVARAASARYPDDLKPSDESLASVSINRDNKSLRIANNSAHEIQGGTLWVNEMYVHPLPAIPAGGSKNVMINQFFNRDGQMLPALTESSKLQLQSAGKLYNLRLVQGDGSWDNK